jgi:hypothetical protein
MRITKADVDGMLRRFERAAREAGILDVDDTLHYQEGSNLNGIGYRIFRHTPGSSGDRTIRNINDYLGASKSDAYNALARLSQGIEAAVDARLAADR